MASVQVRFPQINEDLASGDVALWLAESGAVGTWFGTGSPDLPEVSLAIPIEDDSMAL
jgi:hypothetical protein